MHSVTGCSQWSLIYLSRRSLVIENHLLTSIMLLDFKQEQREQYLKRTLEVISKHPVLKIKLDVDVDEVVKKTAGRTFRGRRNICE